MSPSSRLPSRAAMSRYRIARGSVSRSTSAACGAGRANLPRERWRSGLNALRVLLRLVFLIVDRAPIVVFDEIAGVLFVGAIRAAVAGLLDLAGNKGGKIIEGFINLGLADAVSLGVLHALGGHRPRLYV